MQVATVLTACGIETLRIYLYLCRILLLLQQCLPLAVLKLYIYMAYRPKFAVATVLTACGIETLDQTL